ncbi:MAG: LL-diaminopimelate aminotransferase [Chloroflexi bacterium]|nr:LL-diaminopimelate aminotransferase [Chloroflexota bacterium]
MVHVAGRVEQLPPYLFVQIRQKEREARSRGIDVISLGVGDPDHPTPGHIIDALNGAARDPAMHVYPPDEERGMTSFRQAVAQWYAKRFAVSLDPDREVLALIGSKEGNHHLALAYLNPGDVALIPDPAYPAYVASAIFAGAQIIRIPLSATTGWLPALRDIPTDQARRAKILWLNYPNNPTTAMAPSSFWQEVAEWSRSNDTIVVNDCPYSEIAFGEQPASLLCSGALDAPLVEFNSLSKPYNMTGWRIGMAVGNADIIAALRKVKENTDSGIFGAVQRAGIAALTGPQDNIHRMVEIYRRRRDLVVETWRNLRLPIDEPQATFYVWAPIPAGMRSIDFASLLLEKTGVVVTPGVGYGSQGDNYVRMSLTIDDLRLEEAMERIRSLGQWK